MIAAEQELASGDPDVIDQFAEFTCGHHGGFVEYDDSAGSERVFATTAEIEQEGGEARARDTGGFLQLARRPASDGRADDRYPAGFSRLAGTGQRRGFPVPALPTTATI